MWFLNFGTFQGWVTAKEVFTPEECQSIIDFRNSIDIFKAGVGTDDVRTVDKNLRNSNVAWIAPSDKSRWIFERLQATICQLNTEYFHIDLDYIQHLQLTEYDSEYLGHYGQHMDGVYGEPSETQRRKLSLSIQLTSSNEYEGGDLILYPYSFDAPILSDKDQGSMTLFRSHIIHEVKPVTKGTRFSLVAWVIGPDWK